MNESLLYTEWSDIKPMKNIIIDGIKIEAEDDENILECALRSGIYIPHLCYHPDLTPLGSCRLCIVQVEGQDNIIPSCTLKAEEGLVIKTKSEEIDNLRRLALDLLLSGHPSDCSTCPKYGNCELQTVIQYIGASDRMRRRRKGFKLNADNPLFEHDMNRCVLCGRCVRACNDLRGAGVLKYNKKNMETYIGTIQDKLLKDSDCRFCGACAEVCPTGAIRDKESLVNVNKNRTSSLVPCRAACPAGTDVPRYVRLVKEGKYSEAAAVIREKAPFPKILGYICNHVCELECRRKEVNEPISIRNIKRFAAEHDDRKIWKERGKQLPDTGKNIAVAGSGPAGLTAAYYLRKQGHNVTVFEKLPKAGGMMQFGIPEYRLPRNIIQEEIDVILSAGVEIKTNKEINLPFSLLNEGYDAVIMAVGTHKGVRLPIEGSKLDGVILNTDFLRNAGMNLGTGIGKRVIVLGGGNVAFDCARTARRLGAEEIHVACLEEREKMLADEEEIKQAGEEGIEIHPAQTFEKILGEKHVTGVSFQDVKSFTFDENHRAVIEKVPDSLHQIQCDSVIFAVGQRPEIDDSMGLKLGKGNLIITDDTSLMTETEGIFACGDAVYGTNSVIKAIASGREAAISVDRYLGGDGDISEVLLPKEKTVNYIGEYKKFAYLKRKQAKLRISGNLKGCFDMVDQGLSCQDAALEAERCLQCDLRLSIASPRLWNDYKTTSTKEEK